MNNEIQRKITSLTLMTIMLAGGMFAFVPAMVPAAHAANANLFVSAENSQFNNYMTGPQVIEVVVIDSDIHDTDQAKGEPDVTINGASLRMAQATDGNWYGYFASKTQATLADTYSNSTTGRAGYGFDFGQFCSKDSTALAADGITALFSETVGVAIPVRSSITGNGIYGVNGTTTFTTCSASFNGAIGTGSSGTISANATGGTEGRVMNVVREAKTINQQVTSSGVGQIGLKDDGLWPFVQLYDLTVGGNVVIQYAKGGGAQSTTLTFDTSDQLASYSADRDTYPLNGQVQVTMNDIRLNIDPTDEDSWTFDTASSGDYHTYYGLFDENGVAQGDGKIAASNGLTTSQLLALMDDDLQLQVNGDKESSGTPVLSIVDNADNVITPATIAAGATAAAASTGGTDGAGASATVPAGQQPVTITEQGVSTGIFGTYDDNDQSTLVIAPGALRGTSASLKYNDVSTTILVGNNFATIDIQPTADEWASGQKIPVVLVDQDVNKNSRADEDLAVSNPDTALIPSIVTGDPFTLGEGTNTTKALYGTFTVGASSTLVSSSTSPGNVHRAIVNVTSFSQIGRIDDANSTALTANALLIDYQTTFGELRKSITNAGISGTLKGINAFNWDVRSFNSTGTFSIYILNATTDIITGTSAQTLSAGTGSLLLTSTADPQGFMSLNSTTINSALFDTTAVEGAPDNNKVGVLFVHNSDTTNVVTGSDDIDPIVADFFSFGFTNDGLEDTDRIANQIVRLELEETGDNTATFAGKIQYLMVNQLTILKATTYTALGHDFINDEGKMIVMDDRNDEDAIRVNYLDLGSDGVSTQIADQQNAPTHSGVASFDQSSYKVADTVTVTVEDKDLNVDSTLVDIYTVVSTTGSANKDLVGSNIDTTESRSTLSDGSNLGKLLDITFDDSNWVTPTGACLTDLTDSRGVTDTGLGATGFTLVETAKASGVFVGTFQVPSYWCAPDATSATTVTGLDLAVDYVDFRDASGESIEVGDSAGVRANTGSVSVDRTVYPVPFGIPSDFATQSSTTTPNGRSLFPIHQTGMSTSPQPTGFTAALDSQEFIANGDLIIHVRVNDPDFDISAAGEDKISQNTTSSNPAGPVKISILRGSSSVVLGYAGGPEQLDGFIAVGSSTTLVNSTRQFGPMTEIAPDAGIFEQDVTVRYTDGPSSTICPETSTFTNIVDASGTAVTDRFNTAASSGENYCILQGDILQVEYTDPADASGSVNTVTDSATFDLRNGVLQSDKSVYIIGSDMILTLIEPDFDLDNQSAETYTLDLIEWDSDAATVTMGKRGGNQANFDPEPLNFRETGDSTGIFQVVAEIPSILGNDKLERGEEIALEYTDWSPSGSDYVGDEDQDVTLTVFTSNFGATVALDQKVYSWTDKVYITIVAPDHNFDSDLIDDIGDTTDDPIKVATRSAKLSNYKLVETGTDTGIFTGEVILTGFTHDADGDPTTGSSGNDVTSTSATGSGPTSGRLPATDNDGLTVSFEFSQDETVVGSALIRWNIGEVQWLEASYPAKGTGVVRVIDPDMNLNPESVDNFNINTWSDSDAGGIDLTVTETNEATGIFEGTVFFTTTDESSGHRLRVAEGDTVTAEYEDNTLPAPYTTADELRITATTLIGTIVPPLERAPAANLRIVDAFGNSLSTVNVDQQVQITADLANGQDKKQVFAYLVQIQDGNGVTVSLAWITGALSAGQSFSPALSWIPTEAGTYTATAFVWESVDNPTALSPPVSTEIIVK